MEIVINDSAIWKSDRLQWIKIFEQAGINYCILRDIKSCTGGNPPLEIDILIYNHDLPEVREILFKAGYLMRSNRVEYPHFHFYLYRSGGLVSILDIVVDLRVGNSGKIIRTLEPNSVLYNSKVTAGMKVVSEDDELVLLSLHSLIDKGVMLEKHRLRLKELLHGPDTRINAENKLSFLIGDTNIAGKLLDYLVEDDPNSFINNKYKTIRRLFFNANSLDKKNMIVNKLFLDCHRILHGLFDTNNYKLCSVVGIDGSGKTTFIDEFSHTFSKDYNIIICRLGYGALRRYYFDLTYFLCPIDQNVKLEREQINKKITNFASRFRWKINESIIYVLNKKQLRILRKYVADALLYFEDVIAIRESKKKIGNKGIVLTDRSAIDRIIYPMSRKGKIRWTFRFFYTMIYPNPDLIVFLDCGAETAVKRKGEMTIDEATRMTESYIHFLSQSYGFPSIRLDSNSSIYEIVNIANFALR